MHRYLQSFLLSALVTAASSALAADVVPAAPAKASAEAPPAPRHAPGDPYVAVNGVTLPAIYADILRQDLAGRGRTPSDEDVLDALVNTELMVQEALRLGLDKPLQVQAYMEMQRKEILEKLFLDNYVKAHPIAEERIKGEYDRLKGKAGNMEYHARHILVDDEKLAKDIIAKLDGKKPAKFEDLAKKYSKDSSARSGGDLGWMAPGNLVPEFSNAMVQLKKGGHSKTPVKSQFGWHVIRLDDSRKLDFPDYEKVKDRVANQLVQQELRKHVGELRKTAKVDVLAR
jgi:peptidyl-prolyl cis-trans isomerase C